VGGSEHADMKESDREDREMGEGKRSCEKFNPLPRGVIIVIIYYLSPRTMPARLCIAAECRGGGSHGKARAVAASPAFRKEPNRPGPTSLSLSLSLSLSFIFHISVLVISGRNRETGPTPRLDVERDDTS